MGDFSDRIEHAFGNRDRLLEENAKLRDALKTALEALEKIAKRPDLPNPDRDADWKNCQKWSSHEAKEALEKIRSAMK